VSKIEDEMRILARLEHPNIVRYIEAISLPDRLVIVTEAAVDQLYTVIQQLTPLSEAVVLSLGGQLVAGLRYIHARNIVHRDLKPENILVAERCRLLICDFGFARFIAAESQVSSERSRAKAPSLAST
jgi:serine/threonine protein kinase